MKRKRCTTCGKLYDPRGIKRHMVTCLVKNAPAQNGGDVIEANMAEAEARVLTETGRIEPEPDLFESIVKELKEANLGLVVITLE